MSGVWFAADEVHTLARIFLALFVLIGLIPYVHRKVSKWLGYFDSLRRPRAPGLAAYLSDVDASPAPTASLNDVEHILFTRLALAERGAMSLKVIAKSLHMDEVLVKKALHSLHKKQMVNVVVGGFGTLKKFTLSEKGRALAIAEGFAPILSEQSR